MKRVEVTFWRANHVKAIRIGRWFGGVFQTVARIPVKGSEYTDQEARAAHELAAQINLADSSAPKEKP